MKISSKRDLEEVPAVIEEANSKLAPDGADAEVPKSIGLDNAPACVTACRAEFTKGMGIDPTDDPEVVLRGLCRKLADDHLSLYFWDLYCCDSKYCGVNVTLSAPGLDPQVDDIIGRCAGIGIPGMVDPGPPPADHCGSWEKDPFQVVSMPPTASGHSDFTIQLATSTGPATSAFTGSFSAEAWTSSVAGQGGDDATTPASQATQTSTTFSTSSTPSSGLDTGGQIAIGVCAAIAALALLLALLCMRKRRSSRGYIRTPPTPRALASQDLLQNNSHLYLVMPLTSSSSKTPQPLTPPMRLSDRRFLPSVLDPSSVRSSSAPPYSTDPDTTHPQHPIASPTTTRFLPRHECQTTLSSTRSEFEGSTSNNPPRSSVISATSGPGTVSSMASSSAKTNSITSGSATITSTVTPASPIRPQRPHDTPLEIPGLVAPAGPPPKCALPPTPSFQFQIPCSSPTVPPLKSLLPPISPVSPISPLSPSGQLNQPVSPLPFPGDIGIAIGVVQSNPAAGIERESSSHDLCQPTEAYIRKKHETRDSWGSWSGPRGGVPGDKSTGKREASRVSKNGNAKGGSIMVAVLRELGLARLAGSY
ncbi:hypothetical protein SUNI508_11929 [Seiridium unicorne]|uniref:Uncharacterized protein n=1 Tax=Seiridium unicorne TaxID=138068 RepID=A0ABR2UG37_9PEZI